MIDTLQPPPDGHADAVAAACGCGPLEALSGPMPPGYGVMALIAAPMLDMAETPLCEVAAAMAEAGSEWAWRDALLPFFEVIDG